MQHRNNRGRFARFPWIRIILVLCAIGWGLGYIGQRWVENDLYAAHGAVQTVQETFVAHADETMEAKVERMKDEIVEEIAKCESGNASQDMAIVKYDQNSKGTLTGKNVASIGVLQMKVSTIQGWYKTLHGKELSNYDATLLALDNAKAKAFARQVIFEIKGSVWHWTCATQEMGAKIGVIRELEK